MIARSMHEGCRETFGKRKNTRAAGECIFTQWRNAHWLGLVQKLRAPDS